MQAAELNRLNRYMLGTLSEPAKSADFDAGTWNDYPMVLQNPDGSAPSANVNLVY